MNAKTAIPSETSAPATENKPNAQTAEQNARAEAKAFAAALQELIERGSSLGNLALDELAKQLGESANKQGRPTESAFIAFTAALAHRASLTYDRRTDLARKANAAGYAKNPMHKPVAVQKAKASTSAGSASFRFNAPASVEIALGQ